MYHIFIPSFKSSRGDATSHLLEHCVGSSYHFDYKTFIQKSPYIEGKCLDFYTQFSFKSRENLYDFLPFVSKKIHQTDYFREINRLKDELLDESFFDRLRGQICGVVDREYPSFSELLAYQKKFYTSYWIVDDNYELLEFENPNTLAIASTSIIPDQIVSLDGVQYHLVSFPFETAKDWYIFDFCQRLSGAWIDYQTWYVENLYFPYQFYYSFRAESGYLIYSQGAYGHIQNLDQDFFVEFKSYYFKNLLSNKGNILAKILDKKEDNPESVISSLSWSQIQKFLKIVK